jgi:hypothetical protein
VVQAVDKANAIGGSVSAIGDIETAINGSVSNDSISMVISRNELEGVHSLY